MFCSDFSSRKRGAARSRARAPGAFAVAARLNARWRCPASPSSAPPSQVSAPPRDTKARDARHEKPLPPHVDCTKRLSQATRAHDRAQSRVSESRWPQNKSRRHSQPPRSRLGADLPGTCDSCARQKVDVVHRSSLVAHWMFESSANAFSCFDGRLGRFSCRVAFSCRGRRGGPAGRRRGSDAAAEATASATARLRLGDGPRGARLLVGRAFARKTTEKTPQLPQQEETPLRECAVFDILPTNSRKRRVAIRASQSRRVVTVEFNARGRGCGREPCFTGVAERRLSCERGASTGLPRHQGERP